MQVKANGISVNYELSGRDGGAVVMMSHSLASSLRMWDAQMSALAERFRVLRYDTRGHGGTDAPAGAYSLDQLGDDAVGLMDALKIERAHWIGLSMGGMIGQNLALRHPGRLRSLVLADTSSRIPAEAQPVWEERIETARKGGMAPLCEPTMQRWFTAPFLARNPPELEETRRIFLATPPDGYTGCAQAIRRLDYLGRLGEIRLPTLVVVGAEDQATPVAASEAIQVGIPGATLEVIPQASHLANVEQPKRFTDAVLGFLQGL